MVTDYKRLHFIDLIRDIFKLEKERQLQDPDFRIDEGKLILEIMKKGKVTIRTAKEYVKDAKLLNN